MAESMSEQRSRLEEGEEIALDELPESEMSPDGKWELVDDMTLGGEVDGKLVTLEFSSAEVTDVTPVSEVYDE